MTTAELLALAVLKGDDAAIWPLIDQLLETKGDTRTGLSIPPLKTFRVDAGQLRAIFYIDPQLEHLGNVVVDRNSLRGCYTRWLSDKGKDEPLILQGVDKVEFYELAMIKLAGKVDTRVSWDTRK